MTKGYILVNIPNDCSGCDCCIYWDDYNSYECGLIQMRHEGIVDKYIMEKKCPDWCPIKEFPEKNNGEKHLMEMLKVGTIV